MRAQPLWPISICIFNSWTAVNLAEKVDHRSSVIWPRLYIFTHAFFAFIPILAVSAIAHSSDNTSIIRQVDYISAEEIMPARNKCIYFILAMTSAMNYVLLTDRPF